MTIQVRKMFLKDIPEVVNIEKELFTTPWDEDAYRYELRDNPFATYLKMTIKETNEIIGYIGFWITFEKSQITKLGIAKKYQGYKLSKLLMADCIKRITNYGCENITLEVRVSNQKAISLYHQFGFKDLTIRKKYYDNGEDAILMEKVLL